MYLIIGLGNPEADYSKTRHNMGFNVINKIAEKYNIEVNKKKFDALYRRWHNRRSKGDFIKTTNIYEFKWKINNTSSKFL